ncbi:hypothetical protein GCM10028809_04270 [Spirosoma gilvum]
MGKSVLHPLSQPTSSVVTTNVIFRIDVGIQYINSLKLDVLIMTQMNGKWLVVNSATVDYIVDNGRVNVELKPANSLIRKDGFPGSSVPELFRVRCQIVDF